MYPIRLHTCSCANLQTPGVALFAWSCLIQLWAANEVKADAAEMQIRWRRRSEQKRFALVGIFFCPQKTEKREHTAAHVVIVGRLRDDDDVSKGWKACSSERRAKTHLTDHLIMFTCTQASRLLREIRHGGRQSGKHMCYNDCYKDCVRMFLPQTSP